MTTISSPRTVLCKWGGCKGIDNLRQGLRAALRKSTEDRVLLTRLQLQVETIKIQPNNHILDYKSSSN
jgi:hypothetical protein